MEATPAATHSTQSEPSSDDDRDVDEDWKVAMQQAKTKATVTQRPKGAISPGVDIIT